MEEILKLWNLRTHPFSPEAVPPYSHDLLEPLDPRKDQRLLGFYFDLYEWEKSSSLVRLITKNLSEERFPKQNELSDPQSLFILLAGPDSTGRVSLRNLILHKIALQTGQEPIEVEVDLDSMDPAANVMRVASAFLDSYDLSNETSPTYDSLYKVYDRERDRPNPGMQSFYAQLFESWRKRVRGTCPRPPVLLITGINDYASWRVVYNSTWHLFPFVVVLATDEGNANTCYDLMLGEKKNVVLIKSVELELSRAKAYLQARIGMAQNKVPGVPNVDQIKPFTDEALQALYRSGPTAKPGERPTFHIQWLNRTFRRVLDEHMEGLEAILNEQGVDALKKLSPDELLISGTKLRASRENLNLGQ